MAVFGSSSCFPPLVDRVGKLVWSADKKASLFSVHFVAKQFRDGFHLPHSCGSSPVLCSVAFPSSFVRSLILDLDPYDGNDSDGVFPLLYKQVARKWAPSWL